MRELLIIPSENGYVVTEHRTGFAKPRIWIAESVSALLKVVQKLCKGEDDGRETTTD